MQGNREALWMKESFSQNAYTSVQRKGATGCDAQVISKKLQGWGWACHQTPKALLMHAGTENPIRRHMDSWMFNTEKRGKVITTLFCHLSIHPNIYDFRALLCNSPRIWAILMNMSRTLKKVFILSANTCVANRRPEKLNNVPFPKPDM
jgi:hypothetical protein